MELQFIKQKRMVWRSLLSMTLVSMLSGALQAQDNLTDKLPVNPKLKIGKLSNGLTYYIQKNVRPEKKVELRLAINVGSILEDDDQQGLAHFTEHMAFNGTKNFKKKKRYRDPAPHYV